MNIQHYTYEDFLVYSLSYFGLSSVVERKAREGRNANQPEVQKLVHIMDDCSRMDLSDRARFFKALYKKFYIRQRVNRDKLITDMLSYCL